MKDPIEYEGKVFTTLGQLFNDVRHQKLAVGIPCHPDYKKQEDEILTHLVKLTRDKRNDTVQLPASVPEAKQVLDPSHHWYKYDDNAQHGSCARSSSRSSRVSSPEAMEQDPMQASAPESTDMEMYQVVERDLLITNDYDAGLVRNAAKVRDQATGGNEQAGDIRNMQFKEPDGGEVECHCTPGQQP